MVNSQCNAICNANAIYVGLLESPVGEIDSMISYQLSAICKKNQNQIKNWKKNSQKNINTADNMPGVSISVVKIKGPTYHSLPLEK